MSVFSLTVGGTEIIDSVLLEGAVFESSSGGIPGKCLFAVKDLDRSMSFTVGHEIILRVDGVRVFGGYVQKIHRRFFFPVDNTSGGRLVPRALVIEGVDYNILFRKRIVWDELHPTDGTLYEFPEGTYDTTAIARLVSQYLDLSGDSIDTISRVVHVGSPNPDGKASIFGASWDWGNAMDSVARLTGAIYGINPNKELVYSDVDEIDAPFPLTDSPFESDAIGYRDMEILFDGGSLINDMFVWGAGQGSSKIRFGRSSDSWSIGAHGRWQAAEFRGDIWRQATVDKRAQSFVYGNDQSLRGHLDDAISILCTVFEPSFSVGQKPSFTCSAFGFFDVLPIRKITITFPTTKAARFDLLLSHFIDNPWNTHEYWFPRIPAPNPGGGGGLPDPGGGGLPASPCGFVDTFRRADQDGWGRADSGNSTWSPEAATTAIVSESGSFVVTGTGTYTSTADFPLPPDGLSHFRFSFGRDEIEHLIAVSSPSTNWEMSFLGVLLVTGSRDGGGVAITAGVGSEVVTLDPAGADWEAKIQWSNGSVRFKVWAASGSEPGWSKWVSAAPNSVNVKLRSYTG